MSEVLESFAYDRIVREIEDLGWSSLAPDDLPAVIWAYYFFSIQFRENLIIACDMFRDDPGLRRLKREECDTDNLSPFPGIANPGEKMDHDEFIRRIVERLPISKEDEQRLSMFGARYLGEIRAFEPTARALSIASYETGGLTAVFLAMLRIDGLDIAPYSAFKHFAEAHVAFDNEPHDGHGALCQGLPLDDRVDPLWRAFKELLVNCLPKLKAAPQFRSGLDKLMPNNPASLLKDIIYKKMRGIAAQHKFPLAELSDDLALLETGLDSLGIAILVASLDEEYDLDPFSSGQSGFPVTLGDLIRMYEIAATKN